jgi:CheY-like chemotaxis protein/HPt (histidine-containing phosphotransfer) domain-containing protein
VERAPAAAPEAEVQLRFAVIDTGIGIPLEKQASIFRAFEQEDSSTTRRYGGTGLGLTIAARLVNMMGGTMSVESDVDCGSTFAFTARFGLQPRLPEPLAYKVPAPLVNLPVLVVDENATNRRILEEWLRGWKMQPTGVGHGLAALEAIRHSASGGPAYPLLLLDDRMRERDARKLAAAIRERAELAATRIIVLNSAVSFGASDGFRELRVDAQMFKPIQQGELLETIYRVISRADADSPPDERPAPAQEPHRAPAPATESLYILVAEDNEFNSQLMEQLLIRRGHRVRVATNGREALALTRIEVFDLVLLDLHMPELDGFQVVSKLREREQPSGSHLPVIALTARSNREDRERCLAAGMDDFLSKPVRPAELAAAIDRVLASRPRATGRELALLNPRVLWEVCGGDAGLLKKLCDEFRARVPDHLAAVHNALRGRDTSRLREAAHKLSGMLTAFSDIAGGIASDLEDHAGLGHLDEAAPLVDQLEMMGRELIELAGRQTVESLRQRAKASQRPERTPSLSGSLESLPQREKS